MNRRAFLRRLGLTLMGAPLAGLVAKEAVASQQPVPPALYAERPPWLAELMALPVMQQLVHDEAMRRAGPLVTVNTAQAAVTTPSDYELTLQLGLHHVVVSPSRGIVTRLVPEADRRRP